MKVTGCHVFEAKSNYFNALVFILKMVNWFILREIATYICCYIFIIEGLPSAINMGKSIIPKMTARIE